MLSRLRLAVLTSFIVLLGTLFAVAVNALTPTPTASALPEWSVVTIPGLPSGASLSSGGRGLWTGSQGEVYVWATRSKPTTDIPESWLYKTSDGGATWRSVLYLPDSGGRAVWGTGPSEIFAGAQRCPSGSAAACGTGRGPQIFRSTDGGTSWVQQTLPTTSPPIDGDIAHFAGAPNAVYTTVTTWGSTTNDRILRYNGTSWSVALTNTSDSTYGPSLVYISANEIYGTTCWGHWLWNGSTWTFIRQFDFCDAGQNWGMRDAGGILQLYNSGNNNFTNGVKVWKFTESSTGSKSGSWGSKSGYVFSDGLCGTASGMWGSAGNDVWAIGNLYYGGTSCGAGPNNEGRIYRFNGTSWGRVTTPFDPLPRSVTAVSGTAPDDVWVANNARLLHFAPSILPPTITPTSIPEITPTLTPIPLTPTMPTPTFTPTPTASAKDLAQTFCTIAEWKSGRILSSLDISDATQRAVLDKARSLSFPLTFQFPDIDAFRARISSLKKDVCAATEPKAAKTALEALEAARKSIMDQFKASREGIKPVMDNAVSTFKARVKALMKPYEDAVKARSKTEVDAERARILNSDATARTLADQVRALSSNKNSDAYRQALSALQTYMKSRLQPFLDQLKLRNEAELKATAQQIAGPDGQTLKSIGALFKEGEIKLEAHKAESEAGWKGVWEQVVAARKGIILRDIDAAIARIKADIEKKAQGLSEAERNERGITAFLSALGKARGTLEASLGDALASGKQEAVEQVIGAFQTTLQEAAGRVNMPSSSSGGGTR